MKKAELKTEFYCLYCLISFLDAVRIKDCAVKIWIDLLKMWDSVIFLSRGIHTNIQFFTTPCEEFDFETQKLLNSMHGSRKSGSMTL